MCTPFVSMYYVCVRVYVGSILLYFLCWFDPLILLLTFVFRTSASDCLEDRLRNDLCCVQRDVKPYSLTLS